jgi:hypothetical protein
LPYATEIYRKLGWAFLPNSVATGVGVDGKIKKGENKLGITVLTEINWYDWDREN